MFGGMSRWGNWERQGKDKIKLITTKISTNSGNDKIPDPKSSQSFQNQNSKLEVQSIIVTKKYLYLLFFVLFISCDEREERYDDIDFQWTIDLPQDENNYYHLQHSDDWQTLKRLTANLYSNHANNRADYLRDLVETVMVYWESSHYWLLNDTLGYIEKGGLTDDLEYVSYDTVYVIGFDGFEVPTINFQSYPTKINDNTYEVNQMFAPVQSMIGDTITVWAYFWDLNQEYHENYIKIILD